MKISDWIDGIIQDLVDSEKQLKDTLLKVQVLAFQLKNETLQKWVKSELNGYSNEKLPDYRVIPSAAFGNLIQDRGFGGFVTRKNSPLPIEYLDEKIQEVLTKLYMGYPVSELEHMIKEGGDYKIHISHIIHSQITKCLSNGWYVDSAWQKVSLTSIEGIIGSIKSSLLNFLLELNQEIGEKDNYSIMENKKDVDKLFEKTIGGITGETVNISIGDNSMQTVSQGDNAKMNVAKGENINQELKNKVKNQLKEFINYLKDNLDNLELDSNDGEDIINEVQRMESQVNRDQPKLNIIQGALTTINGIITGITANAYTPVVLEKLQALILRL